MVSKKIKFIGAIILLFIILASMGDNNTNTVSKTTTPITDTYTEIGNKLRTCGTLLQCDTFVDSYVNTNRIQWTGVVADVGDNVLLYVSKEANNPNVRLYGIDEPIRLKLKQNQEITFTGQMKLEKSMTDNPYGSGRITWGDAWGRKVLNIYNAEIQNI